MKMILAALAALLTVNGSAQTPQKATAFTIAGHPGAAQILQINGRSYVDIETLARLTQGSLSFKGNQTTLTLPPADAEEQAATPQAKAGFSTPFVQAGIEEMSMIREWRIAIVNAVVNNIPISVDWVAERHRQAEKYLALTSAAASTDDDRSAYPLLFAEFNNMQKLSEAYLAIRKRSASISVDTFDNGPLEEQILTCARGFVSMTETHEFQDQAACH
jgi:hypothetical protein